MARSRKARRVVVTGGAGFIGSHLCDALVERGDTVVCVDDFSTGSEANVTHLLGHDRFQLVVADVCTGIPVSAAVDAVAHLASAASPRHYQAHQVATLDAGSAGTRHALDLAERTGARFLLASTSEVYGDPAVHPQPEDYWGNVNPVGPRSMYDEAKRFAEALTVAYRGERGVNVAIARIFNTYGPRLAPGDGRVVPDLAAQALSGRPLTVYGDGSQTRSFCYVDDLVRGLLALLDSDVAGPVNIGNPDERTILDLAHEILAVSGSSSPIEHRPLPAEDPMRRCPDIALARMALGWEPAVGLEAGLERTLASIESGARGKVRVHAREGVST